MILTTCAACAAPLAHDAPRCVRCHANALSSKESASLDELSEAVTMLETVGVAFRRRFGEGHPELEPLKDDLSDELIAVCLSSLSLRLEPARAGGASNQWLPGVRPCV